MDDLARANGFEDEKELHRLIARMDLTKPGMVAKFKIWQNTDGTKQGLIAIQQKEK
jgi:hypothetical protein